MASTSIGERFLSFLTPGRASAPPPEVVALTPPPMALPPPPERPLPIEQKGVRFITHFGDSPEAISQWLEDWDGKDAGTGEWLGSSVVMSCAQWIARMAASTQLRLKLVDPENTSERIQNQLLERGQRVLEVLHAKLEGVDPAAFWPAIYFDLLLRGNAYWRLERGARRRPIGLRRIPPETVTPANQTSDGSRYQQYDTDPSGWYVDAGDYAGSFLLPTEVVRLRYLMDPRCPALGLPPLLSALIEIQNDRQAGIFARTVLVKLGFAGTIISPKTAGDHFTAPEAAAMQTQFAEKFSGKDRGGTLLSMKPVNVDMMEAESLRGIDLTNVRNVTEERCCALIGVQPSVIGLGAGLQQTTVGATARENRRASWEGGIIPLQTTIAWQFAQQLMPEFGIDPQLLTLDWNRDQVADLRETPLEKARRYAFSVRGPWDSPNDARRAFGSEPKGEEYEELYQEPPSVRREADGAQENGAPVSIQRSAGRIIRKQLALTEKQTAFHSAQMATSRRLVMNYGTEIEVEIAAQRAVMQEAVRSVADDPSYQELSALLESGTDLPPDAIEELATDLSDRLRASVGALVVRMNAFIESLTEEAAYSTIESYRRVDQDDYAALLLSAPSIADDLIERWQNERADFLTSKMREDASPSGLANILRTVAKRRQVGIARLLLRVADRVANGPFRSPAVRGLLIARTETRWATGTATLATADAVGYQRFIVEDGVLLTSDEECRQRSGMEVSSREADELHAAEHPNGTMSFIPVFTRKTPTLGDIVSDTGRFLVPTTRQRGGEFEEP